MNTWVDPHLLFVGLAAVFFVAALLGRRRRAQARTWLILAALFGLIALWLWRMAPTVR